jgi:hypothetical protein
MSAYEAVSAYESQCNEGGNGGGKYNFFESLHFGTSFYLQVGLWGCLGLLLEVPNAGIT